MQLMMPVQELGFIECKTFSIAANSSKAFSVPARSKVRFMGIGIATAIFDMITLTQVSGAVNVAEIYKGSSITHSETSGTFTVSNASGGAVNVYAYVFEGSVS